MPFYENVKLEFTQKDIFFKFKTSYISVCLKIFLKLCIKKKCKNYIYLNNSKNTEEQLKVK